MNKLKGYCGIMQPYFFPYWGHFSLIAHTDKWVVFDETQYKPKSWMNRNRVLHPTSGWQYLSIPLSNSTRNIKSFEANILDQNKTRLSIKRKLDHYRNKAPFFSSVITLIDEAFNLVDSTNSLTSLCHGSILVTCKYLGITINSVRSSELNLQYPKDIKAGQWAPFIANHLKALGYLNPIGGSSLFHKSEFEKLGLDLKFLAIKEFIYSQGSYDFCPGLSILDSLMWLKPEDVRKAIEEYIEILDSH